MLIQTFNRRIIIKNFGGTSLAVQRLRHCLPMQGARVRVLVRELRYHMPHGQTKQNINNRSDIVTKSICSVSQSCPTLCNLMNCSPPGSSWNFPGTNPGAGCHFQLQGIFPTQGSNPSLLCFLHWQVGFFTTAPPGKPQRIQ